MQKQNGAEHVEVELSVLRRDGTLVRVAVSSVPLKNPAWQMIGSFGLIQVLGELDQASNARRASARRERETLALLAAGHSTVEMAERMAISKETVRNHVKRVLGARRQLAGGSRRQGASRRARLTRFGGQPPLAAYPEPDGHVLPLLARGARTHC